jgi:hypothetical protein
MRLTKTDTERAIAELRMLVRNNPGVRTSELRGTRMFHGGRTLTLAQIRRLLTQAGARAQEQGRGVRTWHTWTIA